MKKFKGAFIAFIREWRPEDPKLAEKFDEGLNKVIAAVAEESKTILEKKARR